MCQLLNRLLVGILVCLFININGGLVQADDSIIKYDAAFTIRDNDGDNGDPDGLPDDIEQEPSKRFWGLITNTESQYDEFFFEFDIRNIEPVNAAKFYFFFTRSTPQLSSGNTIDLTLAEYEGDGIPDLNKFGIGNDFAKVSISSILDINVIDVTDILNSYINSGISYLGIRLYNPFSSISGTGKPSQLNTAIGYLNIISTDETEELVDVMHPTGAVHAKADIHWPLYRKYIRVKLRGYVLDELSVARDEGDVGVSYSFIKINDRKIFLRNDTINLLDENGRFNFSIWLRTKKSRVFQIRLYAADTAPEGPNFGLVDSTYVQVPYSLRDKLKFKDNWFKKYNHK